VEDCSISALKLSCMVYMRRDSRALVQRCCAEQCLTLHFACQIATSRLSLVKHPAPRSVCRLKALCSTTFSMAITGLAVMPAAPGSCAYNLSPTCNNAAQHDGCAYITFHCTALHCPAVYGRRQDHEADDVSFGATCANTADLSLSVPGKRQPADVHTKLLDGRLIQQVSRSEHRTRSHLHIERWDWNSCSKAGGKGGVAGCAWRHNRVKIGVVRSHVQNVVAGYRQHLKPYKWQQVNRHVGKARPCCGASAAEWHGAESPAMRTSHWHTDGSCSVLCRGKPL
jgi:hypothetical protein